MKTVTIPIINDNDYEPDKEFYIILKNPEGEAALGDPSITRAMIIDDDGRYNARKVCPSISFSAWVFKWYIEDLVRSTIPTASVNEICPVVVQYRYDDLRRPNPQPKHSTKQ